MKTSDMPSFLPPDLIVVELGQRLGAGLCGSLLAELGATVIAVEAEPPIAGPHAKTAYGAALGAGKRILRAALDAPRDADIIAHVVAAADIVIVSRDTDPAWPAAVVASTASGAIVCDVTAFGQGGPLAGRPLDDAAIQALSGIMDTSGEPGGAPVRCAAPIVEVSTALYAAAGILLALRTRDRDGVAQAVDVAAFDCAITMLATFLPKHFAGATVDRIGNHHPGMSPWNTYRAKDGWVLLCAGTDDQWRRVCGLLGRPDLIADPRFVTNADRVRNAVAIDAEVEAWTRTLSIAECVDALNGEAISTGPILTVPDLQTEPNLAQRAMVRRIGDAPGIAVPGTVFRGSVARGIPAQAPRDPDADRAFCRSLRGRVRRPAHAGSRAPLDGVRVLEMGQFTTAPLVGRQLGAFGADVVKLEPVDGEPSRHMPPFRDGQGYFFTLSNSDKRVMDLDLRAPGRSDVLRQLIASADIFVENTKPGTLPRYGFTPERIMEINPRLVYCDISGFGADTPFAGRGAMDTTIQGLAGTMDLTRDNGVPYKTGISIGDLHAGQFALVAVLAALAFRDRTGRGQYLDLAMLDAAAWATRTAWNASQAQPTYAIRAAGDGYVLAIAGGGPPAAAFAEIPSAATRAELVERYEAAGVVAVPVLTLHEAVDHPQSQAHQLIVQGHDANGNAWPMLASPIRLAATPAHVRRALGPKDSDAESIRRDWAIASEAHAV